MQSALMNCSATVHGIAILPHVIESYTLSGATSATDNSGNSADGLEFNVGTTFVEYVYDHGNVCNFEVLVHSDQLPIISCPTDKAVNAGKDSCETRLSFPIVVSDPCTPAQDLTIAYTLIGATNDPSGSGMISKVLFGVGQTNVRYTVTNASNKSSTCTFKVEVKDDQNPSITCPPILSNPYPTDPQKCYATLSFDLSPTDNCGILSEVYKITEPNGTTIIDGTNKIVGYEFKVGTSMVEYSITDVNNNTVFCSFPVEVKDVEYPSVTCPTTGTPYSTDPSECFAILNFNLAPIDNCGIRTTEFQVTEPDGNIVPGTHNHKYKIGTSTVSYTITDVNNNSTFCSFSITVEDKQAPTITCPTPNNPYLTDPGSCNRALSFNPITSDNCGVASVTYTIQEPGAGPPPLIHGTGDIQLFEFKIGTSTVKYTVTDVHGNVNTSCSFQVIVEDKELPAITCPTPNNPYLTDPGSCNRALSFNPITSDNCGVASVTYTIQEPGAGPPPLIHGTGDIQLFEFKIGTSTVKYTVTDVHGNVNTSCSFQVIVEDKELPAITCPTPNNPYLTDPGSCNRALSFNPITSDNCGVASVTYTIQEPGAGPPPLIHGTGDIQLFEFKIGTSTVKYTVTDVHGNVNTSCSFQVIVEDKELPAITCPTPNNPYLTDPGSCNRILSFNPITSDNCGVASVTYTIQEPGAGPPPLIHGTGDIQLFEFKIGTSTVKYTVTDVHGNVNTSCSFQVIVEDKELPAITCPTPNNPYLTDPGSCNRALSFNPITSDNCGVASVTYTIQEPGAGPPPLIHGTGDIQLFEFKIGTSTVKYTVTDVHGNVNTSCSFQVIVEDKELPVITCPTPNNPYLSDPDLCTKTLSFNPITSDNCGVASVTYTIQEPGLVPPPPIHGIGAIQQFEFKVGTSTVVYTVTDVHGNENTCSFQVIVEDKQAPTPICKNITISLNPLTGIATITPQDIDDGSFDNCTPQNALTLTLDITNFDCLNVGDIIVKLTVEDTYGNSSDCTATVTVVYDKEPAPEVIVTTDELCEGGTTDIVLKNPHFNGVTEWFWTATPQSGSIGGAAGGSSLNHIHTINQLLTNTSNEAQTVAYVLTPKIYSKCILPDIHATVWVNPQPRLLALADTSICNNTATQIPAMSATVVSINAQILYDWGAAELIPGTVSGFGAGTNVPLNTPIEDVLHNTSVVYGDIRYTLSPNLHLNGNICPSSRQLIHILTVEPTPVISIAVEDTICNNTRISIEVKTLNQPKGQWQFDPYRDIPTGVIIQEGLVPPGSGAPVVFPQTIENTDTNGKSITYNFSPEIITLQNYICPHENTDTTTIIRVEPTPILRAHLLNNRDSICYKEGTNLIITTENRNIFGDMKYTLTPVSSGSVSNVALPGQYPFDNDWKATVNQTGLENTSNAVQHIQYTLVPEIEHPQLVCVGAAKQETLFLAPELKYDIVLLDIFNHYNISCNGNNDGQITISNVTGGWVDKGYTYLVNNAEKLDVITGLVAGPYNIKVRDKVHQCNTEKSTTLIQPKKLLLTADTKAPDCVGPTGYIKLNAEGGVRGCTFRIEGLNFLTSDSAALNLLSGIYTFFVTDANGCETPKEKVDLPYSTNNSDLLPNRTISDYGKLPDRGSDTPANISCYGRNDGFIQLNFSTQINAFEWRDQDNVIIKQGQVAVGTIPNSDLNIDNLKAGKYYLTVINANNGCKLFYTATFLEPLPVNFTAVAPQYDNGYEVSCHGSATGKISVSNVNGGYGDTYAPFVYDWTPSGGGIVNGEASQQNLQAGTYTFTVLNKGGGTVHSADTVTCKASKDFVLQQPPVPMTVTANVISDYNGYNVDCFGSNTGKINVDIQYGEPPYSYQLSTGEPIALDQFPAGNYQVVVTDKYECTGSDVVTLTQPDRIRATAVTTDITCPGGNNGSIAITAGGGVPPYQYHWPDGQEKQTSGDLQAGEHIITITDLNECAKDTGIVLLQPDPIQIVFDVTEPFCPEINDGTIISSVTGGTGPYTYLWTALRSMSPNLSEVKSGNYVLAVTDNLGCTASATVEVGYANDACLHIPNAFSPNDDGANDRWEIMVGNTNSVVRYQLAELYPEAIVEVYSANWGLLLFRSKKGYTEPWNGRYRGKYLPVNSYLYIIRLNDRIKPIVGNITIVR